MTTGHVEAIPWTKKTSSVQLGKYLLSNTQGFLFNCTLSPTRSLGQDRLRNRFLYNSFQIKYSLSGVTWTGFSLILE